MFLLFSVRVAECPSVLERVVHSVKCLSICMYASFAFGMDVLFYRAARCYFDSFLSPIIALLKDQNLAPRLLNFFHARA